MLYVDQWKEQRGRPMFWYYIFQLIRAKVSKMTKCNIETPHPFKCSALSSIYI